MFDAQIAALFVRASFAGPSCLQRAALDRWLVRKKVGVFVFAALSQFHAIAQWYLGGKMLAWSGAVGVLFRAPRRVSSGPMSADVRYPQS